MTFPKRKTRKIQRPSGGGRSRLFAGVQLLYGAGLPVFPADREGIAAKRGEAGNPLGPDVAGPVFRGAFGDANLPPVQTPANDVDPRLMGHGENLWLRVGRGGGAGVPATSVAEIVQGHGHGAVGVRRRAGRAVQLLGADEQDEEGGRSSEGERGEQEEQQEQDLAAGYAGRSWTRCRGWRRGCGHSWWRGVAAGRGRGSR